MHFENIPRFTIFHFKTDFYTLPHFDNIRGIIPDSMHCLWLGITKSFLNLWRTFPEEKFYISPNSLEMFDDQLPKIKVKNKIYRPPRSYKDFGPNWKASFRSLSKFSKFVPLLYFFLHFGWLVG